MNSEMKVLAYGRPTKESKVVAKELMNEYLLLLLLSLAKESKLIKNSLL